ncbi:hypothetical protein ASG74_04185 [Knoellia sp. Soil729]|nr:hypothetical protein ASG74_04185 [Knoellia sp. Soil729]
MAREHTRAGYLVAMSENDKDPQPGEFRDPTASPEWTAPRAPQGEPTEQIPQASGTSGGSEVPDVPPAPAGPAAPSYDAPYQAPRGESDPYSGSSTQPTNPYAATPPPPPADPYGVPQAAHDPYAATGGAAAQGGYPAYNAPGQWQAPPAGYGAPPEQNTSALVLTIVSGITTLTCCLPGIVPLILGIMALTRNATDPVGSRRLAKWGWIAFGIGIALAVIVIGAVIVFGLAGAFDGGYSSDPDYTY